MEKICLKGPRGVSFSLPWNMGSGLIKKNLSIVLGAEKTVIIISILKIKINRKVVILRND
ncbi:hypothetical protein CVN76_12765 [Bacillus sp. mrc49]|nr:hypothetical protein CVN76_12765 [Bacillus sp. mrc49]